MAYGLLSDGVGMGEKEMSMLVLCPSRGRPDSAIAVNKSFVETIDMDLDTHLYFVVDSDDPTLDDYPRDTTISIEPQEKGMGPALNEGLRRFLGDYDMYGFIGDDHRFRTPGWNAKILDANEHDPGIYFANDGVRRDLPTQWFVDGPMVESLGWLALPNCKHFYLDDAWREIGCRLGVLRYMDDILIEHLHYSYGKSPMDATYERNIDNWEGGEDQRAYEEWRNGDGFETTIDLASGVLPL